MKPTKEIRKALGIYRKDKPKDLVKGKKSDLSKAPKIIEKPMQDKKIK